MLPDWFIRLGVTGWPLALCSIAALAIICERLVFLIGRLRGRQTICGRLIANLAEHRHRPKSVRDEIASMLVADLQGQYTSGLRLLRLIATISPMLGLFGTILGIINAFRTIAANAGPVSPHLIADGLWEAMLTTAAGLAIALPSVFMAYVFQQFASRQLSGFRMLLNRRSLDYELENLDAAETAASHRERPAA